MIQITYTLGARGTARFSSNDFKRDTATAFRFDTDDPVSILNETGSTTLFNGEVLNVRDSPIMDPNVGTESAIDAVDKGRNFDHRIIPSVTFPSGTTLRDIVDYVVNNFLLAEYGVSRDAGMASGPALDGFTIDYASVTEVFNKLTELTGWPWRLTPSLVIEMAAPGTWTAAFSLTSSNGKIWGGLPTWVKSKKQKINRVYVKYGGERQIEKTQSFTATAGQTVFTLDYPAVGANLRGYITVNGAFTPLGAAPWSWDAGTNSIIHATGATAGTVVSVDAYDAQFPLIAMAENGSAAMTPLEARHIYPEVFDKDEAQQIADALLAKYEAAPRVLTVKTRAGFEMPGTVFTISVPERAISSSSWMIQTVNIRTDQDQRFTYEYTCVEGTLGVDTWIDSFRSMLGASKSGAQGGTITGGLLPMATGVFGSEVIANTGATAFPYESRLSNFTNASLQGPALILGRFDSPHAWAIVGDHLGAGPTVRRVRLVPIAESSAERFIAQFSQDPGTPVDGEYYLTANGPTSVLRIGARSSSGFGLNHRAADVATVLCDATSGYTERGRTTPMGEWDTWSPVWTNLTVGNGTVVAKKSQLGKTTWYSLHLTFGSTTIISGNVTVTTPITTTLFTGKWYGYAVYRDDSAGVAYSGIARGMTSTTMTLFNGAEPQANISATVPFTFTTNDTIYIHGVLEEA